MFDFLIDIVPREEATSHKRNAGSGGGQAQAGAGQEGLPGQPVQQTGMHPPPQHMPQAHYGMPQHIPEQDYRQQAGMYGQPVAADMSAYGQPQAQPFDQSMYSAYGLPPQQVSVAVRGPAPALISSSQMYQVPRREPDPANDPTHGYRPHQDPQGDADADGEGEDYGP
jgi:nuclear transcription factor Y, gamma